MPWVLLAILPVEGVIIWRVIVTGRHIDHAAKDIQAQVAKESEATRQALIAAATAYMAAMEPAKKVD